MFKYVILCFDAISNPLSRTIEKYALRHPKFKHLTINFAKRFKTYQQKIATQRGDYYNIIKPLKFDERKAVKTGATFFGDTVVFLGASGLITYEIISDHKRDKKIKQQILELNQQNQTLQQEIIELQSHILSKDESIDKLKQTMYTHINESEEQLKINTQTIQKFEERFRINASES